MNLEQVRAAHALWFWDDASSSQVRGKDGGDVLSGMPGLIINNGLLATIAFASSNRGGHEHLLTEVGRFLGSREGDLPGPSDTPGRKLLPGRAGDLRSFVGFLVKGDSLLLQRATAETLEYINYLKRFNPDKKGSGENE